MVMWRILVHILPCSLLLRNVQSLLAHMHIGDQECAFLRAITVG